jgi:HEAT repeat protein
MSEILGQSPTERRQVASDINASPEVLAVLADDPHTGVRTSVGANPATPAAVMARLAQDRSEWVRGAVAGNPQADPDLVRSLADDKAWYVRSQVASGLRAHADVFAALARDPQVDVIRAVSANPQLPKSAVDILRQRGDSQTVGHLASNPALDDDEVLELLPLLDLWQRQEVAKRNPASPLLLAALGSDEEALVRVIVAEHREAPPDLLASLATDPDEEVRTAVHRNPSASEEARATAALLGVQRKGSLRD